MLKDIAYYYPHYYYLCYYYLCYAVNVIYGAAIQTIITVKVVSVRHGAQSTEV